MADIQFITVLSSAACARLARDLRTDEFTCVGIASDRVHAIELARKTRPCVLLLDTPSFNTADILFLRDMEIASPPTRTLLFYSNIEHDDLLNALEAGAKGFMPLTSPNEQCLQAMRAVHGGDIWLSRKDMAMAMERLLHKHHQITPAEKDLPDHLSEREREIARHMRNGLSNKEIAHKLGISDLTVKSHLKHIFHKLNISHRHQLGITPLSGTRQ